MGFTVARTMNAPHPEAVGGGQGDSSGKRTNGQAEHAASSRGSRKRGPQNGGFTHPNSGNFSIGRHITSAIGYPLGFGHSSAFFDSSYFCHSCCFCQPWVFRDTGCLNRSFCHPGFVFNSGKARPNRIAYSRDPLLGSNLLVLVKNEHTRYSHCCWKARL